MSRRKIMSVAAILVLCGSAAARAETLPRYKFVPGQELTYSAQSSFKSGEGEKANTRETNTDWSVWVVRANPDGSFRLVIREQMTMTSNYDGKKNENKMPANYVYADMFPDGRVVMNPSIRFRGYPSRLFPPLPPDATKMKAGWDAPEPMDVRVVCKPIDSPSGFAFDAVTQSAFDRIYLMSMSAKYTFDPARGLVTKGETASKQGWGIVGSGTGTIELKETKTADAAMVKQFSTDIERYFAATKAYEDQTEAATKGKPEAAKEMLEKALTVLKDAAGTVTLADLKTDLDDQIKRHDQMVKYQIEEAERRAKVLGQPASEFETTDIDGKKIKLTDLRGQVVVLDFWYRGCGWCIRAMPQMNQLAADFAGQPVAIFGMNTDPKEEDARFVIEKMPIKYATLKGEGLPQKFGVQGFPTLIIIDQQGKVHDIHVGYSPTLREDVGKVIRELLPKK
jgi:peroxiredoxin/Tfp pilus assembly protein PilE